MAKSPDITHKVQVVEGDTLEGLCERFYNSPSYAEALAQYNDLNKFRHLKGGSTLIFPPLATLQQFMTDSSKKGDA